MKRLSVFVMLLFTLTYAYSSTATKNFNCPVFKPGQVCTSVNPFCGDNCSNTPFCTTTCWPTSAGSAWAGAGVTSETKQLYCPQSTFANCHFSGPPTPTGVNPSENPSLPCKVNKDGKTANCRCKVFTGPSYVNIDGIMNLGVYYETVAVCGKDGSKCKNLSTCEPGGKGKCVGKIAPVCSYVAAQNRKDDRVSFIPGYDLISTYSFDMNKAYDAAGPKGGPACSNIDVAGCMAQPCKYEKGSKEFANCTCPITKNVKSFRLHSKIASCDLPKGYVWE
ncbi:hypothetical protein [Francisella sp. LA112445]|uniref:hypothetical protein n=1 Tax=Francisella sp. LA112445 TaxID=1395624 RepID=UPI001788C9A0|nr:hypothetical protein [Francisella sp. LA112445]QIW10670.1 hypothetical protein FIP56_08130 [Francisella sp. LA112445]